MKKTFVLDTNIPLHDPRAIFAFEEHDVCIPITVLDELDTKKTRQDEVGQNARIFSKELDKLRAKGSLQKGVQLGEGLGNLKVFSDDMKFQFSHLANSNDNYILGIASRLNEDGGGVTLVTNDVNMRVKADALGIPAQDYMNGRAVVDPEKFATFDVDAADITQLYSEGGFISPSKEVFGELKPNTYIVAKSGSQSALCRAVVVQGELVLARVEEIKDVQGVTPKNSEQRFLLDALLCPTIDLVVCNGVAGSGKTLLSLAAGLHQFDRKQKTKLAIYKAITPVGNDIGFLPGELEDKLRPWLQPYFDNLEQIIDNRYGGAKYLIDRGIIEMGAVTYMRGRSIPNRFVIVDETQNLTPKEIKTIVSRIGVDSKLVLLGDLQQIDHPYLDQYNNGLAHVMTRMKGQANTAVLQMTRSERSTLAKQAVELL